MSVNESIFSDNFQAVEAAELCGRARTLNLLLEKMQQISGFIEVELEDHPAEEYMDEFSDLLEKARKISNGLTAENSELSDSKDVKLADLLQEVVKRINLIGSDAPELSFSDSDEYLIKAQPSQLSSACFALLSGSDSFKVNIEKVTVGQGAFSKTGLSEGSYWGVVVSMGDVLEASDFSSAGGYIAQESEKMAAYGTVISHGGEILQNNSGKGFLLLLPQSDAAPITNEVTSEALTGTETILVVDDEDMIWDILIENLQELNYTVLLAENGAEAVEIYRENPGMIDVVILDMVMPVMNGREAFKALKEIDEDVKVILSSGYMAEADATDVIQGGARAFLHKPYPLSELARTIRGLF